MRISWEQTGDEFPTRWDSNCVRRNDNGPMWFGRITAAHKAYLLEVWKNADGVTSHWEHCGTLAEGKARGAEVLRALCGGPALKSATVWCAVTPWGRLLEYTASRTKREAWEKLLHNTPALKRVPWAKADCGFTVRRFRLEEIS